MKMRMFENLSEDDGDDKIFQKVTEAQTPTERYIMKSGEKIDEKRCMINSLREKLLETETKLDRVKSNPRDRNLCRNCYLRLGHTSRSFDYGKCTSVQMRDRKIPPW